MGTFGGRFDPRCNNFDALRLGAALVVLVSHGYSLTAASWEPVSTWLHYGYGGSLAVAVFFVISGFLVTRSVQAHDVSVFVVARACRIIPALGLVTAVEALVLAPYFFDGPVGEYFRLHALNHMRNVLVFGEDPFIPGVFANLPFPYVNGSLWSLPVEAFFYLLLPLLVLGFAGGGRRWVVLVAFGLSLLAEPVARWHGLSDEQFGGFVVRTVRVFGVAQFLSYFLAGVVAWLYRDRIPYGPGHLALCLVLLFAARDSLSAPLVLKLCLPYVVLYLGISDGAGSGLKRRVGDLSYGVYLFSYPVLNSVISLGKLRLGPEVVIAVAAPVSLALAWLSWHWVERPALSFKAWRRRGAGDAGQGWAARYGAGGVARAGNGVWGRRAGRGGGRLEPVLRGGGGGWVAAGVGA